jgi:ATP-dependent Clp protease ATP-binding subunit ClpA
LKVNAETLRRDLEAHLGQAVPTGPVADLPYSRSAKRALERAIGEALALGHASVETDHLLLAVCAAAGPAQQVLLAHGLTIERMRSVVREGHGSRRSHGLLSRMFVRLFHKITNGTRTT